MPIKLKFPQKSKHALIIFLLWAFAPAAWFLLWKDKKYHTWFPKLLWVNGIIFSVIFITQSFIFIPKLEQIYKALQISVPTFTTPLATLVVLAFVLLQIPAGFHLQKNIKKNKSLTDRYVMPILFIFLVDGFIALSTGLVSAIQSPTALVERFVITDHNTKYINETPTPKPTLSPTPTVSPTPKPLTFNEMNQKWGPCISMPSLMYHHIEDMKLAKENNRTGLNVEPSVFELQMNELTKKGYKTVEIRDLINFFESGVPTSSKPILLTFDDAYEDFYFNAYPVLKKLGLKVIVYVPTGLIGNPTYLNWGEISEMSASGLITFGNHTWSHKQINNGDHTGIVSEILTADKQLTDHGLNSQKSFAYPYGPAGEFAEQVLKESGYTVAFTTNPGKVLCKKMALTLPRVRIGNAPLSRFGI